MQKKSVLEAYDIGSREREILHVFDGVIEAPNWLPDGRTLLFNAEGRLYRYDIPSDQTTPVDTGALQKCNNDHVVSADGTMVGFSCDPGHDAGWASHIYLMPLLGGAPRQVTRQSPSFLHGMSFDGRELAYCAFRGDQTDIYVIPASGGEERRLTDGVGYNDGPEYAPDDQSILFNSTRNGLMQIFRMNRDGSGLTQMTRSDGNNWFPHMSPDGRHIVYLAFRVGDSEPWEHLPDKQVSLWMMDADGSRPTKLTEMFGGQGTINVNSWSPDSKRFAFVSYQYV